MNFKSEFVRHGLIKVSEKRIQIWIDRKESKTLLAVLDSADYLKRKLLMEMLGTCSGNWLVVLLSQGLNDKVKCVFEAAAQSVISCGLAAALGPEIIRNRALWEDKESRMRKNWDKSPATKHSGVLIDQSVMVRTSEARSLIGRQMGSMGLG